MRQAGVMPLKRLEALWSSVVSQAKVVKAVQVIPTLIPMGNRPRIRPPTPPPPPPKVPQTKLPKSRPLRVQYSSLARASPALARHTNTHTINPFTIASFYSNLSISFFMIVSMYARCSIFSNYRCFNVRMNNNNTQTHCILSLPDRFTSLCGTYTPTTTKHSDWNVIHSVPIRIAAVVGSLSRLYLQYDLNFSIYHFTLIWNKHTPKYTLFYNVYKMTASSPPSQAFTTQHIGCTTFIVACMIVFVCALFCTPNLYCRRARQHHIFYCFCIGSSQ